MVTWNGKKDVIGMLLLILGWPLMILLVLLLTPLIISNPHLFIIIMVMIFISGLVWLILRK